MDIGVAFRINYLIFEAYNAGSFLQRFGRVGRHEGFPTYQAHALLPSFVLERFEQRYENGAELEREVFNKAVREVFPKEAEFRSYRQQWGVVQAAQVLVAMQNQNKKDDNDAFSGAVAREYEFLYGMPEKPVMERAMKKYRAYQKRQPETIQELNSFRGLSPLSCGVWDTDGHLKTYDLFFLLTNTEFVAMTAVDFLQEVERRGLEERDFKDQLLYFKVEKYMPESQKLILSLPHDLHDDVNSLHHVQVLDGFFVSEPTFSERDQVNRRLQGKSLTCIMSDMGRKELKQRLHLGAMFPVQRLQDRTGAEFSVVFGQEALLLDSLLVWRKTKGDAAMFL